MQLVNCGVNLNVLGRYNSVLVAHTHTSGCLQKSPILKVKLILPSISISSVLSHIHLQQFSNHYNKRNIAELK